MDDIKDLTSLANSGKAGFNTKDDVDIARLEHMTTLLQTKIAQQRANTPSTEPLTDAELISDIGPDIEAEMGYSILDAMASYQNIFKELATKSIVSILPMMLTLQGRPYSLEDHFPMEPMFRTELPIRFLLRCGRQVSKSTTLAAQGFVQAATTPYFNSLFVTPLFEQCRRFSANYVRPFITESPLYSSVVDGKCTQSVLQKSFKNQSRMFFSYCLKDADRIRGIAADRVTIDECQDIDWDMLPVILETMSASKWAVMQAAGTPKTLDNTIEYLWDQSSQAEWITRCTACGHHNIAAIAHDLLRMLGDSTIVCAKCAKPINPRPAFHANTDKRGTGFWCHAWPERATEFPGYHAPQVIFPMHFANERKWRMLKQKTDPNHTPRNVFINEVLGEGADSGLKLLTHADVLSACRIYGKENKYIVALKEKTRYADVAVGVDWGGSTAPYGTGRAHLLLKPEESMSYAVMSIVGLKQNGRLDVLYTYRFSLSDHLEEAKALLSAWKDVDGGRGNTLFCHDYGGAGSVRETLLVQAGLPVQNVMGLQYVHAPQMKMAEWRVKGNRGYWSLDKARSLLFLCQTLKSGFIGLPSYETYKRYVPDFLSQLEDHIERPGAADIMRVIRKPGVPDDAIHSVNYAAAGLWRRHSYPSFNDIINMRGLLKRLNDSAEAVAADHTAEKLP